MLNNARHPFLILLLMPFIFSACSKEKIELVVQGISANTTYDLYNLHFVNDSIGYACGGEKWAMGLVVRTTDGGKTWSAPDSLYDACAYKCHFFNAAEGVIVGNNSYVGVTSDSGKTFFNYRTNYKAITDLLYVDRQHVIKVGGDGYANGYISYSTDGENSWKHTELPNAMMTLCAADSHTIFAGGYGVIYRSLNAGEDFEPLNVRGDFFVSSDFPTATTGYFAGYEGTILKTTNAGASFKTIMKGNVPFGKREHFRAIRFWDENTGYATGDAGLMYRTIDGGESWQAISKFTSANLRSIHLFSADAGIIAGDDGKIFLFKI